MITKGDAVRASEAGRHSHMRMRTCSETLYAHNDRKMRQKDNCCVSKVETASFFTARI